MIEKTGYWEGWDTTAFVGCDEEGEPKYSPRRFFRCSDCRYGTVVQTNYCPNCGAKMLKQRKSDHGT